MTAVAAAHSRFPENGVSDAKIKGQRTPFQRVTRLLVGVALFALLMLCITSWRDSLIRQGFEEGEQAAQIELSQLRANLRQGNAEAARLRTDLAVEIAKKKDLAVRFERAEAARKQAVADHRTLAEKIKAYEAKKPASAKHR